MITIKKIIPPPADLYDPNNTLLGTLNEYELLDARVQIKKANESGYYIIFNKEKIRIDRQGEMESYPIGLFDLMSGFWCELI